MRVDPDNRLVAASLEADWNQRLRGLSEAQEQYEKEHKELMLQLSEQHRAEIIALASNFKGLWTDPNTTDKDRKRMCRLIIEDVTLRRDKDGIHVDVRFKGGACRSKLLPLPLSAPQLRKNSNQVVREIDRLSDDHTDVEIASLLNAGGFRTVEGKYFCPIAVRRTRAAYKIKSRYDRYRAKGYLTSKEMASVLRTTSYQFFRLRDEGLIVGVATTCRKDLLYSPLSQKEVKKLQFVLKER